MTKIFQTLILALFFASGLQSITCAGVTAANKTTCSAKLPIATHPANSLKAKFWIVTAMYKM